MADKILSLESVKKCLEKIKELLDKKVGISDVEIIKNTLGYTSGNLFDFDSWFSSVKTIHGGGSFSKTNNGITINSDNSTDAYTSPYGDPNNDGENYPFYVKVRPNTTYTLSFDADNTSFRVQVFFLTNIGVKYSSYQETSTNKTITFTTCSDTKYITIRFSVKTANVSITFSNIQLQLGNSKIEGPYQPYVQNIEDRLSNIPVLKKKVLANVTPEKTGAFSLLLNPNYSVVLEIYHEPTAIENWLTFDLYKGSGGLGAIAKKYDSETPFTETIDAITVFYLDISNCIIPEDTTTSSDETENDEGLATQSYTTYEKPSETKQFHGESLYE